VPKCKTGKGLLDISIIEGLVKELGVSIAELLN